MLKLLGEGMMEKKKTIIASISLALIALVWGTSYSIMKNTVNIIEPYTLMTIRFVGAVIFLSLIYINKLIKINLKDIINGSIIGLSLFGAFYFLIMGTVHTEVSKQSFLIGSFVILVPFLRWLINKKKPDIYAIIGAICALIGLAMLTLGSINGVNKGDLYSLLCAFFFGLHMIAIEKYCNDSDPIILTIVQFSVTAIIFLFLSYFYENFDFSAMKDVKFALAYLVIVSTVIGFVAQNIVQKYLSATSTALILTLESAFGSLFAVYYLKEQMSAFTVIACVIIFFGIVTQETKWEFLKKKT